MLARRITKEAGGDVTHNNTIIESKDYPTAYTVTTAASASYKIKPIHDSTYNILSCLKSTGTPVLWENLFCGRKLEQELLTGNWENLLHSCSATVYTLLKILIGVKTKF